MMETGTTCKKIPLYARLRLKLFIVEKAKIFRRYGKHV